MDAGSLVSQFQKQLNEKKKQAKALIASKFKSSSAASAAESTRLDQGTDQMDSAGGGGKQKRRAGAGIAEQMNAYKEKLVSCLDCSRNFLPEALQKHSKVCQKVFGQKRNVFDASISRVRDTEFQQFFKPESLVSCPDCAKTFKDETELQNHQLVCVRVAAKLRSISYSLLYYSFDAGRELNKEEEERTEREYKMMFAKQRKLEGEGVSDGDNESVNDSSRMESTPARTKHQTEEKKKLMNQSILNSVLKSTKQKGYDMVTVGGKEISNDLIRKMDSPLMQLVYGYNSFPVELFNAVSHSLADPKAESIQADNHRDGATRSQSAKNQQFDAAAVSSSKSSYHRPSSAGESQHRQPAANWSNRTPNRRDSRSKADTLLSAQDLYQCNDCMRSFGAAQIEKHMKVCKKVFGEKRQVFDATVARLKDTEFGRFYEHSSMEPCTRCQRTFPSHNELLNHQQVCNGHWGMNQNLNRSGMSTTSSSSSHSPYGTKSPRNVNSHSSAGVRTGGQQQHMTPQTANKTPRRFDLGWSHHNQTNHGEPYHEARSDVGSRPSGSSRTDRQSMSPFRNGLTPEKVTPPRSIQSSPGSFQALNSPTNTLFSPDSKAELRNGFSDPDAPSMATEEDMSISRWLAQERTKLQLEQQKRDLQQQLFSLQQNIDGAGIDHRPPSANFKQHHNNTGSRPSSSESRMTREAESRRYTQQQTNHSEKRLPLSYRNMQRCEDCGRTFKLKSFDAHAKVCRKLFVDKVTPVNFAASRVKDTPFAAFHEPQMVVTCIACHTGFHSESDLNIHMRFCTKARATAAAQHKAQQQHAKSPMLNVTATQDRTGARPSGWRNEHQRLQQNFQYAKECESAVKRGVQPPPVPELPVDSMVSCPHCARKFSSSAAQRHVEICAKVENKPKPLAQVRRDLKMAFNDATRL
eukprot:GILK01012533.1.p1 GENE.GILK01012533.1~~GILK01012533.1.p1  ORF type:complete len:1062 (+),score=257.29 GILK01012533.1:432-3188(+)